MNLTKPEFAEYVKNMRESARLSHGELAKLLDIDVGTARYYENPGDRRMPWDTHSFVYDLREIIKNQKKVNSVDGKEVG